MRAEVQVCFRNTTNKMLFVLDYQGFHNNVLQTEWLKQQKLIFLQYWRLEVRDQGARKAGFW